VRRPIDLLIIGLSGVGLASSVEAIVLYVKRKAIRTMGGYLSHAGASVMIAGILISGVYEERTQVTLPKGEPIQVGRSTMTFIRTVFVSEDGAVKEFNQLDATRLADRRAKQAMEVEVKSPQGKVWKAYPKMYQNEKTRQMMANPDVDSSVMMDLYLSPQSYDPGSPARLEGSVIELKKGETKSLEGVSFKFLDFSADRSQVESDTPRVTVTARYLVTTKTESNEVEGRIVMLLGGAGGTQGIQAEEVAIPGTPGRFRIRKTSASEGISEIEVLGLNPGSDLKPATQESFSVDVTRKPLISLVWTGFYIMMAGGILAMIRRTKDANQAALA
jgi:cytochrome c biogenesis factor